VLRRHQESRYNPLRYLEMPPEYLQSSAGTW